MKSEVWYNEEHNLIGILEPNYVPTMIRFQSARDKFFFRLSDLSSKQHTIQFDPETGHRHLKVMGWVRLGNLDD